MSKNTNCLDGWECPNCQEAEEFLIRGAVNTLDVTLCDLGTTQVESHGTDWDPFCPCVCMKCSHECEVWEASPPYEKPVRIDKCEIAKGDQAGNVYNYLAITLNDGGVHYIDAHKVADAAELVKG
jgi:hypothetical protein